MHCYTHNETLMGYNRGPGDAYMHVYHRAYSIHVWMIYDCMKRRCQNILLHYLQRISQSCVHSVHASQREMAYFPKLWKTNVIMRSLIITYHFPYNINPFEYPYFFGAGFLWNILIIARLITLLQKCPLAQEIWLGSPDRFSSWGDETMYKHGTSHLNAWGTVLNSLSPLMRPSGGQNTTCAVGDLCIT